MSNWNDFNKDGMRLERIIKILFKHLKKAKSDEKIVRLSNSIAFITSKKLEIAKADDDIQQALKLIKENEKAAQQEERKRRSIQRSFGNRAS